MIKLKLTILLLLVLSVFDLRAQNLWEPFLQGEVHTLSVSGSNYFNIRVDSVYPGGALTRFWLNRNILPHTCFPSDTCQISSSGFFTDRPGKLGHYVDHRPYGPIEFVFEPNDTFTINFMAPAGQPLPFHTGLGLSYQRQAARLDTILGQPDSLMTFNLSNGDSIILSKSHGLVSAPSLRQYLFSLCSTPTNMSLAALQQAGLGPHVPDFLEVFDFDIGDEFEWRTETVSFYTNFGYHRLTILGPRIISVTGDSVSYLAAVSSLFVDNYPTQSVTHYPYDTSLVTYTRVNTFDDRKVEYEATIDSFGFGNYREATLPGFSLYSGQQVNGVMGFLFRGSFQMTGCSDYAASVIDGSNAQQYAAGMGMVYSGNYGITDNSQTLTCFYKNGSWTGTCADWSIYLANEDPTDAIKLQVHPNPTSGLITVTVPKAMSWQLLDFTGRSIQEGAWPGKGEWELDLGDQPHGMYLLRAGGAVLRVVKE